MLSICYQILLLQITSITADLVIPTLPACNMGEYSVAGYCFKCDPDCNQCSGPYSYDCVGCLPNQSLVLGRCQCKEGHYLVSESNCQSCDPYCRACLGIGLCVDCYQTGHWQLINNVCICDDGYYATPGSTLCQQCHDTCKTCLGPTNGDCLTCKSPKQLQNGHCECQVSIPNLIPYICKNCYYMCTTCYDYLINTCTSCVTNAVVINNVCRCNDGYFEDYGICQNCPDVCATCISLTICQTCITNRQLSGTTCVCVDRKHGELCNKDCISYCVRCTAGNNCQQCDPNRYFDAQCKCNNSYGLMGLECVPCNDGPNCKVCQANYTICTECIDTKYGTNCSGTCHYSCQRCEQSNYNNCLACRWNYNTDNTPLPGQCNCPATYIIDVNFNCNPPPSAPTQVNCNVLCNTCNFSIATSCLTCKPEQNRTWDNVSTCNCLGGYTSHNNMQVCISNGCPTNCLTCSGSDCSTCLTTETNRKNEPTNNCPCNEGYYQMTGDPQCKQCSLYYCKKCKDDLTTPTCEQCKLNRLTAPTCQCQTGYYDNNSIGDCLQCKYECVACNTNNTQCLMCIDNRYQDTNSLCPCLKVNYADVTTCLCNSGYFYYQPTEQCLPCHPNCKTCQYTYDNCLECARNRNIIPTCKCSDAFYESDDLLCIPCYPECLKCDNQKQCLSCADSRLNRLPDCPCQQLTKFSYIGQFQCYQCHGRCAECKYHYQYCIACSSVRVQAPLCICPKGYYEITTELPCAYCSKKCINCVTQADNCITCAENRILPPICNCKAGYYDVNGQECHKCINYCESCVGSSFNCTSCQATRHKTPACTCKDGYYETGLIKCAPCHSKCTNCNGPQQDHCIYCQPDSNRQLINGKCVCQVNYIEINSVCMKCQIGIEGCYVNRCGDGIIAEQESCDDNNNVSRDGCSMNCKLESRHYCVIQPNQIYPAANISICTICPVYCLECDAISCKICQIGYFLNDQLQCQLCNEFCVDCTGPRVSHCLTCNVQNIIGPNKCNYCDSPQDGLYILNQVCVPQCGDGILRRDYNEQCDDGNLDVGDGCSNTCQFEDGYECIQNNLEYYCYQLDYPIASLKFEYYLTYQANRTLQLIFSKPMNYLEGMIDLWTYTLGDSIDYQVQVIGIIMSDEQLFIGLNYSIYLNQSTGYSEFTIQFNEIQLRDYYDGLSLKTQSVSVNMNHYTQVSETVKQVSEKSVVVTQSMLISIGCTVGIGVLFGSFDFLWNLLDGVQQFSYLQFVNVNYPYVVDEYLKLFEFAQFDFIGDYIDFGLIDPYTKMDLISTPKLINKNVEPSFIYNIASVVIMIVISICTYMSCIFIANLLSRIIPKIPTTSIKIQAKLIKLRKQTNSYYRHYVNQVLLRLFYSTQYDVCFAVFTTAYFYQYTNHNQVVLINILSAGIVLLLQVYIIHSQMQIIINCQQLISNKEINNKVSALIQGVKLNKSCLLLSVGLVIKRSAFIIALIGLFDHPILQTCLLLIITSVYTVCIIKWPPNVLTIENIKQLLIELSVLYSQLLNVFYCSIDSNLIGSNVVNIEYIGISQIALYSVVLFINLLFDLKLQFKELITRFPKLKKLVPCIKEQ